MLLLVALGLLSEVTVGMAFMSDMQALYLYGSPAVHAPVKQHRGAGWRRTKVDAPPSAAPSAAPLRIIGDLDLANVSQRTKRAKSGPLACSAVISGVQE